MRVTDEGRRLVVRSTPGCFWAIGLWFVAGGVFAIVGPWIATNAAELSWKERLLSLAIGLACAGAGLFVLAQAPAIRVELDRLTGRAVLARRTPWRRERVEFAVRDVVGLELSATRDSDGDLRWTLALALGDGRRLPLVAQAVYGRAHLETQGRAIQRALALPDAALRELGPDGPARPRKP